MGRKFGHGRAVTAQRTREIDADELGGRARYGGDAPLKLEIFLPYQLNVVSTLISLALSRVYARRYNIGVPEWRVLVTLGQYGVMTGKAIGAHTHMHKTKVSRAVALLENRTLLVRRANRADMREFFLSLTATGRAMYEELAPHALDFTRRLTEILARDREAFDRALKRLTERSAQLVAEVAARTGDDGGRRLKLYSYFRSSAAYRVRIALNLKGIAYDTTAIHLVKDGGHNRRPEFRAQSANARADADHARGRKPDSIARHHRISRQTHPQPPLLPKDPIARAKARALPELVACDIHPLNNTSSLRYLKNTMSQEQTAIDAWYHHWVLEGFEALEQLIEPGPYCCGSTVTIADTCLVPQLYNARRLKVPLDKFPTISL